MITKKLQIIGNLKIIYRHHIMPKTQIKQFKQVITDNIHPIE